MLLFSSRYLGEEEESKSNGESRSKTLLSKLQERAKAREQQSRATKKECDVQGTKTSEQSGVGKTKLLKKRKRKESISEQEDVGDTPVENTDLGTSEPLRKKKKKKDKKGSRMQEDKDHTGSCAFAYLPGK